MLLVKKKIDNLSVLVVDTWWSAGFLHGFLDRMLDFQAPNSEVAKSALIKKLNQNIKSEFERIFLLKQTHSTEVITLVKESEVNLFFAETYHDQFEADAWIVDLNLHKLNRSCFGTRTADCLPVIIKDQKSSLAAVIHCGWKGTIDGILPKVIVNLIDFGCQASNLEIAIGPGAQGCCYEVGSDLIELVTKESMRLRVTSNSFICNKESGVLCCNISSLLQSQAEFLGVSKANIVLSKDCTICCSDYFSFRRENSLSGRQLSFIGASPFVR